MRARKSIEGMNQIPLDILLELILGLGISLVSGVYTFGLFKDVKAAIHIKKTPQSEFDYTKHFYSGKATLAATLNEFLSPELTELDPTKKNPTLARFIDAQ